MFHHWTREGSFARWCCEHGFDQPGRETDEDALQAGMNDQSVAWWNEPRAVPDRGGTKLSTLGVEVLRRYKSMERKAIRTIEKDARDFAKLLKA